MESSGLQTTEFWLVVIANVLTQIGALQVPDRFKGVVLAASILGYALSRGLAKLGNKGKTVIPQAPPVPDQGDAGKA